MNEIREIHGVLATKMQAGPQPYAMPVTVWDDQELIVIKIGEIVYPGGMTSGEARLLAGFLSKAADRLDAKKRAQGAG